MNVLSLYPAPSLVCWLTASFSPHHTHHSPSAPTRLHPPGVPPPPLLSRLTTEIKTTPKWLSLSGVFPRPHCPVTCTRLGMRHVPEDIGLGDISKNWSLWSTHWVPGGTVAKDLPAIAGDTRDSGSMSGSERSPGGENGNPLQWKSHGRRSLGQSQSMGSHGARHD